MIDRLAIEGYRSIRSLVVDLAPLTVVTGRNGTGKSSLYRALRLLAAAGQARAVGELATDGGLDAVRWAGPERISRAVREGAPTEGLVRSGPVALRLGFGAADGLGYAIDLGLPVPSDSRFDRDPDIKQEHVFAGLQPRPASMLVERRGAVVHVRGDDGRRELTRGMAPWSSLLDEHAGAADAPEIAGLRRTMRGWRFHDAFRTDAGAPARRSQVGTRSPRLDDDGANLGAVLQTSIEAGFEREIRRAVADAFDGSELEIVGVDGRMAPALRQPGILRLLGADELSDGTLQFLLLLAALTSVERPSLIVLNEPERSLHAALLAPLAALIRRAAEQTQVLVVTHHAGLADALDGARIELEKEHGQTVVAGREGLLDQPGWGWPTR